MTDHDDLSRSLRALAASAPHRGDDLGLRVQRRAEALQRRRRRMATSAAGVLVVASVAAGVGLAGGNGGSAVTAPSAGDPATDGALPRCPTPPVDKPSTEAHVAVSDAEAAKIASGKVVNSETEAGFDASASTGVSTDGGIVMGTKGQAVIDAVGDDAITFHFDGEFGSDPTLAPADLATVAVLDDHTLWQSAGVATTAQNLTIGQRVALVVIDRGDGARVELVDVDPEPIPADSRAKDNDGVANETAEGDVGTVTSNERSTTPSGESGVLVTTTKGKVEVWSADSIVIGVADGARPSLIVTPDGATVTMAGGTTCSPDALPVGTEVLVKASSTDDGLTWRLVSLAY